MSDALLDAPALARRLADEPAPTVIDVRWRLGGPPGHPDYLAGHIPGAAFLDLDRDVCGPPGPAGRHPLPDPAVLEHALRRAGVRADRPVICYDLGDGMAAARLWWTLRWAGHTAVAVLDGGWAAWIEAGLPEASGEESPAAGDFSVMPGGMPTLDAEGAAQLARTGLLLDARATPRYRGEVEPIDPVAGHIPGALNLPLAALLDNRGRLRDAGEIRETVDAAALLVRLDSPASPQVGAYCGSGVTAAQTVLALHEAGIDASLYVGSWSNWIADASRPIARGEEP